MGAVIVVYGALYLVTLSVLHTNGFTAKNMIVGMEGGQGDSFQYPALAETMLEHGRFAMSATDAPESFRTPGYPVFIAFVLALFRSITFLPVTQIILAALSCSLVFLIGVRFFSRGIALAAALLFAIEPAVISSAFVAMSDTLFVFVLLLGIYLLVAKKQSVPGLFSAGLIMGSMALIRPLGLYVIPIVFLWVLWESRDERRLNYRNGMVFLIGAALIIVPWMVRNYMQFGHFSLSSVGSYNANFYVREFEHQYTGKSKEELTTEMFQALGATTTDRIESFRYADKNSELALAGIFAHPFLYTAFHLYSMMPFYFGSSIETFWQTAYYRGIFTGSPSSDINISVLVRTGDVRGALDALTSDIPGLLERLVWLILCVAAFVLTLRAVYKRQAHAPLYVFFLSLILAFGFMTGPVSYSRYRLPVEPFIFLLGCTGIVAGVRRLRSRYGL